MSTRWHNFFFVLFDPGGLITVDKPPLALWVQALSAKLFGFTPLSLLLPEAIMGVLAVAALYWVLTSRFGAAAGVAPRWRWRCSRRSWPSPARERRRLAADPADDPRLRRRPARVRNGQAAHAAGCSARSWGWRSTRRPWPRYLVVPGLGLGYLACAPGSLARRRTPSCSRRARCCSLVSASWSAVVELTPASQRPSWGARPTTPSTT